MARINRRAIRSLFAPTKTEKMIEAAQLPSADPLLGRQKSEEIFEGVTDPDFPAPEGHRTPQRNINLDRLEQPEESDKIMDIVSQQTDNAGYKPMTMEELRGELDIDDHEIYQRLVGKKSLKRDSLLTGAQLTRGREISASSALKLRDQITSYAERMKSGQVDDIERLDLQRAMLMHTALQSSVQKETRNIARALSMHQDIARPFNTMQIEEMMNVNGGREVLDAKIKHIADSIDSNADTLTQLGQLNKAMEQGVFAKFVNQLVGYRTVQLLSSPTTHARNITGNFINMLASPAERFGAAIASTVTGRGTTEFGEAYQLLLGTFGSFTDGLRMARKTWQTGETSFGSTKLSEHQSLAEKPNVTQYTDSALGKAWDYTHSAVMAPGKALLAEDEFFKVLAFNGEMRSGAYRQARSEGMTGSQLRDRIDELLTGPNQEKILKKVNDDFAAPDLDTTPIFQSKLAAEEKVFYDMYAKSTQFAHYQTFTDPLKTKFATDLGKVLRNPIARMIVPFYRTPANILAYATERSILAPMTKQWREDFVAGGARRDLAEARMAMGSVTSLFIGAGVWNGQITGSGPSSPELRKMYKADGWRRSSFKIGDKWVTYQGFDPFSTQMAVIANTLDAYRYATSDKQREHLAIVSIFAAMEAMKDRSFLQGVSDFVESAERIRRGEPARFITTLPASFIPFSGLLRNVRKTFFDDVARSTRGLGWADTVMNEVKTIIPLWSESLPPQVDIFGQVRRYDEPYGPDMFSPFAYSASGDYGASTELSYNAVPVSTQKPVIRYNGFAIDTMAMTDDRGQGWKYFELQRMVGEARKSAIDSLIETEDYKNARSGPPEDDGLMTQGDMLDMALQKARSRATKQFMMKNEKQIIQMIESGSIEKAFWPETPQATTDKFVKQELTNPSF